MIKWGCFSSLIPITHFDFTTMDSVLEFLYPKLILFVLGFWSSVSTYLLHLLRYFTRFTRNGKGISSDSRVALKEAMEDSKQDSLEFSSEENDRVDDKEEEAEAPEFSFAFKFPNFDEFCRNQKDCSELLNSVETSSVLERDNDEYIDSHEVSLEDCEGDDSLNDEFWVLDFPKGSAHVSDDDQRKDGCEDEGCVVEEMMVESSNVKKIEEVEVKEEEDDDDSDSEESLQKVDDESVFSSTDKNTDSTGSDNLDSPMIDLLPEDGFLSDGDFELELDENSFKKSDFLSEKDFGANSTNANGNEKNLSSDTAANKLESLWEHQELIEQLKMEIKKVRAIGLPTIFEESESPPKIIEELKPWKIEEVYQHGGDNIGEIHKFYKSYRERMRKFDIFSYQKMYAIGFLQLKDPLQSSSSTKSSVLDITTLLSQSFTTNKGKKHEDDPTVKFVKELQSDLEVVYVGQMCLSWEILHWQYEKALDIWESDQRGVRRFNEISGEFQQFQVLMQRFIEDEAFQGPRIQNYVKTRCVFRNLLQVPVIRDDHSKNRKASSEFVYDMTSDALVEILEESIRIFWRFVRADKYKRQEPVEFQRPEDEQLFIDLQKDLHKKERKLKEQLRSGNCILKKLRRCKEEDETEDQVLFFFCQVDMKLVSRVLQMSRLTSDQLIWCHNKLSKVSFVNRKIHVEPSFFLFPC